MPRPADLVTAVQHAVRAPSVHNTQPWRWRVGPDAVELYADRTRHLVATDPDGRDILLSCGAALHHLLVALAAQGAEAQVERLPDVDDTTHLATVTPRPGAGLPADPELFPAIARRRTDRRRMSHREVPAEHLRRLAEHARAAGASLLPVTGAAMRDRLAAALAEAAQRQQFLPGYATELQVWTRRYAGARDGLPAGSVARSPVGTTGGSPLRAFPHGRLEQPRQLPGEGSADDAAELLVLTTATDTELDRIRAGEAASAVLLGATRLGLATTPLSQGMEVDVTREVIARDVLGVPEQPHLVLRVGWPAAGAEELPSTPRRDLRSVLTTT